MENKEGKEKKKFDLKEIKGNITNLKFNSFKNNDSVVEYCNFSICESANNTTKWTQCKISGPLVSKLKEIDQTMKDNDRKGHTVTLYGTIKPSNYIDKKTGQEVTTETMNVNYFKEINLIENQLITIKSLDIDPNKPEQKYLKGEGVTTHPLDPNKSLTVPIVAFKDNIEVLKNAYASNKQIEVKGTSETNHYVSENNNLGYSFNMILNEIKVKDRSMNNEVHTEVSNTEEKGNKPKEKETNQEKTKATKAKSNKKDDNFIEPGF